MKPSYIVVKRTDPTYPSCHSNDSPRLPCFSNSLNNFEMALSYVLSPQTKWPLKVSTFTPTINPRRFSRGVLWALPVMASSSCRCHSRREVFPEQLHTLPSVTASVTPPRLIALSTIHLTETTRFVSFDIIFVPYNTLFLHKYKLHECEETYLFFFCFLFLFF